MDKDQEFKNFHRVLCERFGYTHDPIDWKRDQISLIEHIAKECIAAAETFLEAGRRASDLSKCSGGSAHVLYAIHTDNWVEEVGCERCTFKVVGHKRSTANSGGTEHGE